MSDYHTIWSKLPVLPNSLVLWQHVEGHQVQTYVGGKIKEGFLEMVLELIVEINLRFSQLDRKK